MESLILQTNFMDSSQLLSQPSLTADENIGVECNGCSFQDFFNKASDVMGNSISNTGVSNDSDLKIVNTDTMEINASLFLSILGINPDIAIHNQVIDLTLIENKDLENVTAVDFLKNLGFSEDSAKDIVARVLNVSQKLEVVNKTDGNTQISSPFGRQVNQPDYTGSLSENIIPEDIQKDASKDFVQIQKSLEDVKNIVSDKLELKPVELKSQFTPNRQDILDKLFNKTSVVEENIENIKILNSPADNNSLKAKSEDIAGDNRDIKISHDVELIDKEGSSSLDDRKKIDSDSFNLDKSFPENREVSVKYASANTGLKGFDAASAGIENASQSSKTSLSNSVINQIVENAQIIVKGDKKEIKIHLDPPSLGSIHMKVTADSHSIKVTATADTPYVKEVIESNLNELKRSLADSGIKVEQFSVFVGHGYSQNDTVSTPLYHIDKINIPDGVDMTDNSINLKEVINNQNLINIFV